MASAAPLCVLTISWPGLETGSSEAHVRPHCVCVYCALYTVQVVTTRDTSVSGGQGPQGGECECDPEGLGLAAARNCWDT